MKIILSEDAEVTRFKQAAEWAQRLHETPDDAATLDGWLRWCSQDVLNLGAFEQMQQVWLGFGSATPARPGKSGATESAVPRRQTWFALAASVLLAVTAGVWFLWRGSVGTEYIVGNGEQRSVVLADGSHMDVSGGSRIRVQYTEARRELRLEEGEAFFSVAHDVARPFVVDVGALHVIAIGTAFDVRHDADKTVITVSQGRVQVESLQTPSAVLQPARHSEGQSVQAEAGQRVIYSTPARSLVLANVDARVADSWRSGVLNFVAEPLSDVVNAVSRHSGRRIVVVDPGLRQQLFTGTVDRNGVDEWLSALEKVFPLQVQGRDGAAAILVPRSPAAPVAPAPVVSAPRP